MWSMRLLPGRRHRWRSDGASPIGSSGTSTGSTVAERRPWVLEVTLLRQPGTAPMSGGGSLVFKHDCNSRRAEYPHAMPVIEELVEEASFVPRIVGLVEVKEISPFEAAGEPLEGEGRWLVQVQVKQHTQAWSEV